MSTAVPGVVVYGGSSLASAAPSSEPSSPAPAAGAGSGSPTALPDEPRAPIAAKPAARELRFDDLPVHLNELRQRAGDAFGINAGFVFYEDTTLQKRYQVRTTGRGTLVRRR